MVFRYAAYVWWKRPFLFTLLILFFTFVPTVAAQDSGTTVFSPPPSDGPVEVFVELYGVTIGHIDEREELFEVEAYLYADWFDDRLAFDPDAAGIDRKVYQGETAVEILKTDIWWPELEIVDARGLREKVHISLTVDYDGFVTYTERFKASISQPYFLEEFPFDSHEISFTIAPFYYFSDEVIFIDAEREDREEWVWETNEWELTNPRTEIYSGLSENGAPEGYPETTIYTTISRIPNFYVTSVMIPLLLIVTISWAVFWMKFDDMHLADRLSVSFTSVLTVVAFDFVSAGNLPRLPYATVMDRILTLSYVLLSLAVLENVVASFLWRRDQEKSIRLDKLARIVFPIGYIFLFLMLLFI